MIKTFLIGVLMWACDMVPWVSGGTIALVTGIYEKLLTSIKNVLSPQSWLLLVQWKFSHFWDYVSGVFLVVLFAWIALSVLVFSYVFESLLITSPELVWGFFLWLVIATIVILLRKEISFGPKEMFWLVAWWGVAYMVTLLSFWSTVPVWWYIVLSAAIAITAMILPGISWSFLLLVLWMYTPLLGAINQKDLVFLWLFALGAVLWLWIFSRVISYILLHYRKVTMSVLIGFMIWSLPILWPRQNPSSPSNDSLVDTKDHTEMVLVSPDVYEKNARVMWVILLFLVWVWWWSIVFNKFDQAI